MGAKQTNRRRCDLPFVIAIAALKIASFGPGQTQSWSTVVGMSKFFPRSLQHPFGTHVFCDQQEDDCGC